ncbi:MAG: hypothetical protein JSW61_10645 [Candidatus Thorarchaeota archaeon]|nr:MAG: hypothetical protein JSW61_10645 [Candidatus Thorarchaeota archaeon]
MAEPRTLIGVISRFRLYLVLSLVISFVMVPVADGLVLQRDRNRNMVYGELFWQEGFYVYDLSDSDLQNDYGVPSDHLLTGVLNVTYEYPMFTLLFYAFMALIEPGQYGNHWLANWVLVLLAHVNLILFLYLGQNHWDKKWFRQLFFVYYAFSMVFSVGFAKTEPMADLLWMSSLILFQNRRFISANALLGFAVQTKLYPALAFPFFMAASPIGALAFLATLAITSLPLVLTGVGYSTLLAHLQNSAAYSELVTNPFFIGLFFSNPASIIAPAVLFISLTYMLLQTKTTRGFPIPLLQLKSKDWRRTLVFASPLILVAFSWVLIWYYSWFLVPFYLLNKEEDRSDFRWMIAAIWIAHFSGILLNLEYFVNGPIAEFFGHLK